MRDSPDKQTWRIHFFRRPTRDGEECVPARDFLGSVPAKIAAEMQAVLVAVAEAPPPAFSGGGKWEAMHGTMAGCMKFACRAPDRTIGCSASWTAQPTLPGQASSASMVSRNLRVRPPATATIAGSGSTPTSSGSIGPFSTSGGTPRCRQQVEVERLRDRGECLQCRVGALGGEDSADCLRRDPGTPSQLGFGEAQLRPALVQESDHPIDLVDAVTSVLISGAVVGIFQTRLKVPLSSGRTAHDQDDTVASVLRRGIIAGRDAQIRAMG